MGIRSIRLELKKAFYNRGFLVAALSIAVIQFLNLLDEMHIFSGSVLYLWMNRETLGGFSMLTILLAAVPYTLQFSQEYLSGSIKPYLIREKYYSYMLGKIIATIIMSAIAFLLGYLLLYGALRLRMPAFPHNKERLYDYAGSTMIPSLVEKRNLAVFLILVLPEMDMFIFLSMISLLVSAYTKNRYLIMASPMIVYYGWNYVTGTFLLPDIFKWPLAMTRGFEVSNSPWLNLLFTSVYYAVGDAIMAIAFCRRLKGDIENV